ncbi:hypothetical protein ACQ4PT_039653 [Festuca glaucescens]
MRRGAGGGCGACTVGGRGRLIGLAPAGGSMGRAPAGSSMGSSSSSGGRCAGAELGGRTSAEGVWAREQGVAAGAIMCWQGEQRILNKNESGRTLDMKTKDAEEMYMQLDPKKKPFTLKHCYVEFEKYPKWKTQRPSSGSQKKQKKTSGASPSSTSNDEDFGVCTDALENEQRPRGTKYEKERKGKAQASDGSGVKLSLESVWAQKIERDDMKEAAKSARYAMAFELQKKQIELKEREDARQEREDARKQFELEEKIMFMDTSGMSVAQKQFYKDKQDEIAARRNHTSG